MSAAWAGRTRRLGEGVLHTVTLASAFLLAAALVTLVIGVGLPVHIAPDTGAPLPWWTRGAQVFLTWLPWMLVLLIIWAPLAAWLANRRTRLLTVATLAGVACLPALVLFIASPAHAVTALIMVMSGAIASTTAYGLWLSSRGSAWLIPASLIVIAALILAGTP